MSQRSVAFCGKSKSESAKALDHAANSRWKTSVEKDLFPVEKRAEKHVKASYDEMEDIEWYFSNRIPLDSKNRFTYKPQKEITFIVQPYFGFDQRMNTILFRMKSRYVDVRTPYRSSDWIFYEPIQFLGVENKARLNIKLGLEKKAEVSDHGFDECSDNLISAEEFENLMKSKTIRVKFYGKLSQEFELIGEQYWMFEEILYKYLQVKKKLE